MNKLAALLLVPLIACAPPRGTVGAVLSRDAQGRLHIAETPDGLAADKAGLQPNDEIILIDGMDVRALSEKELRRALRGEVGDKVRITALRGEEVVRVTLKRSEAKRLRPKP